MRLMISVVATVALVAVAISMLRSRPPSIELSAASTPSLNEFHETVGVNQLPFQEVEDQALIYPAGTKQ
jgi:hypothetical protein